MTGSASASGWATASGWASASGVGVGLGDGDGVGVGLGDGVGVGDGAAGASTTTSRRAASERPRASRTVSWTYFVPATWNVKRTVSPLPIDQSPSPSAPTSLHVNVHGASGHDVALASSMTC